MNEDKKKKLKDILKKISSPEEMAEFESDIISEKLDVIASAFGAISVIKGKDYFTKPEIEWFIKKSTPVKGKDYIDGKDGVDGKNGLNGEDGEIPRHKWTKTLLQFTNPDKTWGELVDLKGEKGEIGLMPKHEWKGTKLRFETAEGKWGKLIDLKGKDGTSSKWTSPGGWIGGGISKFTQLSDVPSDYVGKSGNFVKVKSTEDGLEFDTSSTTVTWGGIGGTLSNQTDLSTALGNKLESSAFSDVGVTGKLITGFSSGAGTVAGTDTILQAINKLNGNIAGKISTYGSQTAKYFLAAPNAGDGTPSFRAIVASDIPALAYDAAGAAAAVTPTTLGLVIGTNVLAQRTFGTAANNNTGDFLAAGATAVNSALLENHNAAYFQVAGSYAAALSGTINEIAYFNSATTIASLAVATYPSLTELSYVKGVTSAIQTQFTGKLGTGLALLLAGGTMTGGITNSTSVNPLTTLAESWIGPSSTTGIYFKGGNVGIGTTSPGNLLDVESSGNIAKFGTTGSGFIYINQATAGANYAQLAFQVAGGDKWHLGINPSSNDFAFYNVATGSNSLYIQQSTGNVGIGTTGPTGLLEVKGSSGTGKIKITDTTNAQLYLTNTSDTSSSPWLIQAYQNLLLLGYDGLPSFNINPTGNVGIGTTGPNYKLEISTDSAGKPGIGGLWTVVSDERIKTEIELADLDRCYEIIKSVPLKRFGWAEGVYTDEQVKDRHGLGWIAQDVQKVFPKAVNTVPFTKKFDTGEVEEYEEPVLDEKGEAVLVDDKPQVEIKTRPVIREEVIEDCLDLNSGQLIAALYGAVQKLQLEVEKLKKMGSKIIAEAPVEPMEEVIKG